MSLFDRDNWQEMFNSIKKHKLRTFLTGLGVYWGIFMLIFLMGGGKGLENGTLKMFGDNVTNSLFIWGQRTSMPYKGLPTGRRIRFTNGDVDAIKATVEEIEYLAPRLSLDGDNIVRGTKNGSFELRGEMPDMFKIEPLKIIEGRVINNKDINEYRKVIVIGTGVQEILYEEDEEVINTYIKIKGAEYQVVGLFEPKGNIENRNEDSQTIIMPMSTGQRNFNIPGYVDWFVCSVTKDSKSSVIQKEIEEILKGRHKVSPEDDMAIGSFNLEKEFAKFQGLFGAISMILWVVGIGTLLAGIVGVGNVMLIVVKERTREIGIRKSLGATPSSIIQMIMIESIFVTFVSGFLGLFAGTFVINLADYALKEFGGESPFYDHPEVSLTVGLGALLILVISGAVAGWIPARMAARINPVLALKDE